jgi:hypothetical protein
VGAVSITYDGAVAGFGSVPRARPTHVSRARKTPAAAPVRLTRRGRLVVVLAVLVVLVAGLSLGMSSQAAGRGQHRAPATVTVQPGESLWQVATRVAPDADPRLVIDQLQKINRLPSASVAAGQQLVVPAS